MIVASRKDLNEAIKWSKKNSPIAYFVLSMNGKWGVPNENPENIVAAFKRLWPETRAFLRTQAHMNFKGNGKITPSELEINYSQNKIKEQIKKDFYEFIFKACQYLNGVEEYIHLESFCVDLLALFNWDEVSSDIWNGTMLYAIDKQDRHGEAFQKYSALPGKSEKVVAIYSLAVLDRCDTRHAAHILDPFRDSEDEAVQGRITLLDRLKAVKG